MSTISDNPVPALTSEERLALAVGLQQLRRGEQVSPNVAAVIAVALHRVTGGGVL